MKVQDMNVATVTWTDLRALLLKQVQLLWARPELARQLPPLMLWGPPGIGKSALFRSVCDELGVPLVDVRLAQREPVDLRGIPVPDGDQVRWLVSSEWPRDPQSRGIILFDELSSADRAVQVAAYELLLDRRLGDTYQVPDGWYLCGAGNRASDASVVTTMSAALANRFLHLEMKAHAPSWVTWARSVELDEDVCDFIEEYPQHLFGMPASAQRGWPSPRSWERLAVMRQHVLPQLHEDMHEIVYAGLIGPGIAVTFRAWERRRIRRFPIVEMLTTGSYADWPQEADQMHQLLTSLVKTVPQVLGSVPDALGNFLKMLMNMTEDHAVYGMMLALRTWQPKFVHGMSRLPGYHEWLARFASLFQSQSGAMQALPELPAADVEHFPARAAAEPPQGDAPRVASLATRQALARLKQRSQVEGGR
jgi:hypothetical protein